MSTWTIYDYIQQIQAPYNWLRSGGVTYDVETEIGGLGRIRGKRFTFEGGRKGRQTSRRKPTKQFLLLQLARFSAFHMLEPAWAMSDFK